MIGSNGYFRTKYLLPLLVYFLLFTLKMVTSLAIYLIQSSSYSDAWIGTEAFRKLTPYFSNKSEQFQKKPGLRGVISCKVHIIC